MKRIMPNFLGISLVLAFGCVSVWAQGTAQMTGTVTDQTGALLPGVDVTATQTDTGISRSAVSDETGAYVFPNLSTGPYRLEATLPGFQTYSQTGIVLAVNTNAVVNAVLQVGQVAQTIEVTASAALVETRNVGVGSIMENERILELPLNGRNVTELIILSGAAVTTGVSSSRSMPNQLEISVAGSQEAAVNYVLDGAVHNNWYDNLSLPLPFPDALGEFKVETSALNASQGGHSGANVNAITKSGTNELHGNLFWFVRNDLFGAREYGAVGRSTLKRNQYGGTVGGPIIQNKLFFFTGYQGTVRREDPGNIERYIPSSYALSTGDWSRMLAPGCGAPTSNLSETLLDGTPSGFVNNQINPALYNPIAVALANRLPTDRADDCGRVVYGNIHQENDWQSVSRVDWQATDAHSILARFMFTSTYRAQPYSLSQNNILTSTDRGYDNLAQNYTLGDTWLISPTTVLSSRLTVNYTNVLRTAADFVDYTDLGVANYFSYVDNFLRMGVNDGFTLGGCTANPAPVKTFSASINSDLSMTRGAHQLGFGGSVIRLDNNGYYNCNSAGDFNFDGDQTGFGLADLMVGAVNRFTQATPNTTLAKKWVSAMYAADTWRVTPNLTLSYGVRWEPDMPETITNDRIVKYVAERFLNGVRSTRFTNAPVGFSFVGDDNFQGQSGRNKKWLNFAPRLGLAWDVFGDGRTSLRASGGIAYDYPNAQFHLFTSLVPPFGGRVAINDAPFGDPWVNYPGGNIFPVDLSRTDLPFPRFSNMSVVGDDFQASETQSWNLALQHQVGSDWVLSATYMGAHTIKMSQGAQVNPALYFPGSAVNGVCTATSAGGVIPAGTYSINASGTCSSNRNTNTRRILFMQNPAEGMGVGAVSQVRSTGTSNYHGLLLSARRRVAGGVNINTNYTWSHCISPYYDGGFGGSGFNANAVFIHVNDREASYGNCSQDRRHNFTLTPVLRVPEFENTAARVVASDWQLAVIYRINSGSYLSIRNGSSDRARNGTNRGGQFANQVSANPLTGNDGPDVQYLSLSAFEQSAIGTIGNHGNRSVRGPSNWDFDVSLSRSFDLSENQALEFRVEAYNLTNSFRPGNPEARVGRRNFGVTRGRSSDDPRILQFALKLAF